MLAALVIAVCVILPSSGKTIFDKPVGFDKDGSHDSFFRRLDLDGDSHISKQELTQSLNISDTVFEYLIARRSLTNSTSIIPGLTYTEFMWFYRESELFANFETLPCPPSELYSFPAWPGMKSTPLAEASFSLTPEVFWSQYVGPHKAVVLRNGLSGSIALEKWNDPEYLKRNFGDLEAKIEVKKESRGDKSVLKPKGRARIKDVIDGNVNSYIVSVVPQPMAWEVVVPSAVLCGDREGRRYLDLPSASLGSYLTQLEETSLWISKGTTRSQLHYDKENTMNCLVSGNPKKWVLLDTRKYAHLLPWVRRGGYNQENDLQTAYTDWVGIDVDALDLNLHEYFTKVEFEVVTQFPGDCVFLPYSMLHYAEHIDPNETTLQVAVSYMWLPETRFQKNCHAEKSFPLAVFDHVWYFDGFGVIPQGLQDPRIVAAEVVEEGKINMAAVQSFMAEGGTEEEVLLVLKILQLIQDMLNRQLEIPLDLWLHLASALDMNAIECNDNKMYVPRSLEEMNRMINFLV